MDGNGRRLGARLLALLAGVSMAWSGAVPAQDAPVAPPAAQEPAQPQAAEQKQEREPAQRQRLEQEMDDAVAALRDYSLARREEALARARQAGAAMDERIERLQAQADRDRSRMGTAARLRSQQAMADLRQRRGDLAQWYDGMQRDSDAAWDEVKTGFVRSYRELAHALRRARAQLQPPPAPAADAPAADAQEPEPEER